jgi:hypothetical protein
MTRIRQSMISVLGRLMGRHEEAGRFSLQLRAWMMQHLPGQLTCMEFERFVHDYQEGSLSLRERRTFDLHMDLCPMCRVYFATYLRTIDLEKRAYATDAETTIDDLPDDLVSAILAARSAR